MYLLLPPSRVCIAIGERVRVLRLAHAFSQSELAARAGCSLSSVRRLEATGQAGFELIVRVAQVLNATDALEAFFAPPQSSIADIEAAAAMQRRQRAPRRQRVVSE